MDLLKGTLDLLILKTLSWGPAHGYAIARWIERLTSEVLRIGEGSLYPALHRLEERGLVESEWRRSAVRRLTIGRPAALLAFLALLASPARSPAQGDGFDPFPGGSAAQYRLDLARNFFPTPTAEAEQRALLVRRLAPLDTLASRASRSPAALLRALTVADTLSRMLGRHYAYLSLRFATDTRNTTAEASNALAGTAEPPLAALERALAMIPESTARRFLRQEPRLQPYAFAFARARRGEAHRLSAAAEEALATAEYYATEWGPALFTSTLAATDFGTVSAPEGTLDVRRQPNAIRNHASREVRETGYRKNQAGLASRRDTYALILSRQAAARTALARLRNWPDYVTQTYAERYLTPVEVRSLLDTLAARAELNKRYERVRAAGVRQRLGYDTVHVWDLTAPLPGAAPPRLTIQQATQAVIAAAAPLGEEYARELRALLDPANGRLDIAPGPHRVERPGFSTGSVGYPSTFFQGRFEGFAEDVVILAHEAGHAVQSALMDRAGVLPRYAAGPNYFTESFATLGQLLLLEHLYRTAGDSVARRFFLERLLDDGFEVFRTGYEALLEHQLYDTVATGRLLSADQIEALTQDVGARFSIWLGPGSERTLAWVQPLQFYNTPALPVELRVREAARASLPRSAPPRPDGVLAEVRPAVTQRVRRAARRAAAPILGPRAPAAWVSRGWRYAGPG